MWGVVVVVGRRLVWICFHEIKQNKLLEFENNLKIDRSPKTDINQDIQKVLQDEV